RPISIVAAKFSAANCGCAPTKARSSSWHDAPPGGFVIDDRAMKTEAREPAAARAPLFLPFYYGWFVVALSFRANLTAAGIRSAPSVLIHPLEAEFGWSRTAIASAESESLAAGHFRAGGRLADRPHRRAPGDSRLPEHDRPRPPRRRSHPGTLAIDPALGPRARHRHRRHSGPGR